MAGEGAVRSVFRLGPVRTTANCGKSNAVDSQNLLLNPENFNQAVEILQHCPGATRASTLHTLTSTAAGSSAAKCGLRYLIGKLLRALNAYSV
jgi:hypothetical protein